MSGLTWLLYTWLLWVVAGAVIGASAKGRANAGAALGLLLGPLGLLVIFTLDDVRKKCPQCQSAVPADALICRYCQSPLKAKSSSSWNEDRQFSEWVEGERQPAARIKATEPPAPPEDIDEWLTK